MNSTLDVGIVNVRDEEHRLSLKVHKRLENSDVGTLVGGEHGYFDIGNWWQEKKRGGIKDG